MVRGRLVALSSERVYLAVALISLGLLYWLISASGRAPNVVLWEFAPWQLWVPNLVMPVVVLLAVAGIGVAILQTTIGAVILLVVIRLVKRA